ncbi:MAG TPA: hypothetical protein V6D47_04410, partial [Oscillatoriaceae cyanobacterium]
MRPLGLAALALVLSATAVPARSQVIIEEAPGSQGASMEPTFFLNTETARIMPGGLQYLSLAAGNLLTANALGIEYNRGMGAGGELQANVSAGLYLPYAKAMIDPDVGLGYKQRIAILGNWDVAINGQGSYAPYNSSFAAEAMLGLPFTTEWGPGDLTLEPRAVLQDLTHGPGVGAYSITAGYRLPLGYQWRFLSEIGGGYFASGHLPAYELELGLRYTPLPTVDVDAGVSY